MNVEQAIEYVGGELSRIEAENAGGELRPWHRDACPAASEHWGLTQRRIALEGRDLSRACLADLGIIPPGRTEAQKAVLTAARQRREALKAA